MNSYWRRSLWSRRTTSGHPRSPWLLPSRNRPRKTPGQRHPRAAVLPPINSWPILPTKSISLALASSHQDFRERCPMPSRRPSRSQKQRPRSLASPARLRKCSTSSAPNSVRWAWRTRTWKRIITWVSRFVRWGSSRRPSASSKKLPKPTSAGALSATPCNAARFSGWPSWKRASRPSPRSGTSARCRPPAMIRKARSPCGMIWAWLRNRRASLKRR